MRIGSYLSVWGHSLVCGVPACGGDLGAGTIQRKLDRHGVMRRTAILILGMVLLAFSAKAAPDLKCSILVDQFTDVSGPEPVKKVQLTVSVVNLGDSGATNTGGVEPVLVFRDLAEPPTLNDVPDAFFNFTTLASGAEASFDLDEVNMAPGSYKAWCWVNPDLGGGFYAVADEENFEDNVSSKPYIVTPPPIAAPDLVVTSFDSSSGTVRVRLLRWC